MVLPVLSAIGAGLSAVSALKSFTDGSDKTSSTSTAASSTQSSSASTSTDTTSASELQDRFLKLLVAQMKNQDPLNPLDNAQVTTQLAQISTVSGIDKMNTTLSGLSTSMLAAQSAQSASLIGRQVYAAGSTLTLSGTGATGAVDVKQPADRVTVMLSQLGITLPSGSATGLQLKNVAAVMVTANLAAFARPGQTMDVTVSSLGNAKSLRGGTLLLTPLKGADGQVYALAQGNVLVGGIGASSAGGTSVTVNHLSVGRISGGATVERMKRFITGGEGEVMPVLRRTADKLRREKGSREYLIVELSEGIESRVPIAQRVAHAVVELR